MTFPTNKLECFASVNNHRLG